MRSALAQALAEALETGQAVLPLSPAESPPDIPAAEEVAAEGLELLGLIPCGLRLLESGLAGPLVAPRLLPQGPALPSTILRHGRASPALVAILAEPLSAEGEGLPPLAALHPALDLSASRYLEGPATAAEAVADLAGLGQVVIGRPRPAPPWPDRCALAEGDARPRARAAPVQALLEEAARRARAMGGLPAGAALAVVFDRRGRQVAPGRRWRVSWPGLGHAAAMIEEITSGS
ncbi:MAG: hypothetical protein N2588_03025 [Rhodovarius sp.]|nr:hypothetical protein [Rhodovarius sp.]